MRSLASSTRCAAPHALPSSSSLLPLLGVVFTIGAMLFALGTWMVRREAQAQMPVVAPVDPEPVIERGVRAVLSDPSAVLSDPSVILSDPSVILSLSKEELQRVIDDDPDERMRDVARDALLVIGARGVERLP